MKIKSLILAFPILCLACNSPSSPSDPASQMEASPLLAKAPSGVRTLSVDFNYDEPCNILGEEYVRQTFNLEEKTELAEAHTHNGCEFEWAGNKVVVAFGGARPFASVYQAEYNFDKMYQAKPSETLTAPVSASTLVESAISGPETEGTGAEVSAADSTHHNTDDKHPDHAGESAATPPLTSPAVSKGKFEAVPNVGDKAVWDATTGAMHVLYNNHIISIMVETKGKSELKKEQAQSLTEVLIEKISANEYTKRL
ncbi:hypothetical protein [Spirosoma validum]|uniref:Uncharacterized protein n=1 Tax=Spirosoma validum TaxID=2771355 RepID=A0A927B8V3_9BACT|nr:hypothetical protein [Spirosoma validum]MBD2757322.1 hypothetical protein [Spirosoma validum]